MSRGFLTSPGRTAFRSGAHLEDVVLQPRATLVVAHRALAYDDAGLPVERHLVVVGVPVVDEPVA